MDVASLDLWFRRGISVITLAFGIAQLYLTEKNIWVDAGFIICMAGIVGYYTNFLFQFTVRLNHRVQNFCLLFFPAHYSIAWAKYRYPGVLQ